MERPHVLIVDDDQRIRGLLFNILDRAGYHVSAAADGMEALEVLRADHPDVLLVDLRMPRMDGRSFVRKALEEDPHAVILVLTGHGTVETAVEAMRAGVYSIITKPFGMDDIVFMVEKGLRDRKLAERSRELEKRLETSERLAMIGKLAAGVAHELNSPLDGVMRFVKLTRDALPPDSELRGYQEEALGGLVRMSAIIRDLLTFSRNVVLEAEEESLEKQLRDATKLTLAAEPLKRVDVTFDLAVPRVSVPRGMFQVFRNLLKNAVDALDGEGRVEIRGGLRDGEVFVSVRDDGCGIPREIRDRVLEPFFTTKKAGSGTGLGLSIVSRIVERFGGGLEIESEEGRGTTVTVYLPAAPAPAREHTEVREPVDG